MLHCISVDNMRESDAMTIARFVPSLELMGRAARGVFAAHRWQGPVAILCGSGNNGGDGFALACLLKADDIPCAVFTLSEKQSADSAFYAQKATAMGVAITPFSPGCLKGFSTVVDCLLGTGFKGGLRDPYRQAIEAINASGAFVVSVDINSGLNGDTGECDLAVRSQLTVTVGFLKHGLLTENAGRYMDRLVCADIGIRLSREERHVTAETAPPWVDLTPIVITKA
ncbi:MAG: NAD(P)H-hydrate epimerase [Clostridia bacterium]|nr:NAD(P)H-hydrate epimerase [Clostridia bacterium]